MSTRAFAIPRGPVLDWASFGGRVEAGLPSVEDARFTLFTTSGRAAIHQALLQLKLPAGSIVLVPSYHCPTMVAPVVHAGLEPAYFGLGDDALPRLQAIDGAVAAQARAMIVAHYFGLPRSLAAVRAWCDERGIALIEDCAHCLYGIAGDRPVGAWGDYATASLTKFLPVPEGGLLASARRPIERPPLAPPGAVAQLKGWVDVFELAQRSGRLRGTRSLLGTILQLKQRRETAVPQDNAPAPAAADALLGCDMTRTGQAPLGATKLLRAVLPRGRIVARRRAHHARFAALLADLPQARPLFDTTRAEQAAPYAFALFVDEADRVYEGLRRLGRPVFRWDQLWQPAPTLPGDNGTSWSRHVLQLLCHQDLSDEDVTDTAEAVRTMLRH